MVHAIMRFLVKLLGGAPEIPSPPGMIKWKDLEVWEDENEGCVSLDIDNIPTPFWTFSNPFDTDSMDGAYDVGHAPLMSMNKAFIEKHAVVGAWVSWNDGTQGRFHQIIRESVDKDGWYCTTMGLNLAYPDPHKVRLDEIQGVCFGILFTEYEKDKTIYVE